MPTLAPIAQTQRVGTYIVGAGSSTDAAYGNVSTNLIAADEDWSDVLTKDVITVPLADAVTAGTQMPFHFRCPRGVWPGTDGVNLFNHCNSNGVITRVPGAWHALNQAAAKAGGIRLTEGFGTLLAGLNGQGSPTTVYNNGIPNYKDPDGSGLTNWEANPLTQGNGYPTITNATDLDYIQALYQDELTNGCTEFAFDGCGGDRSTYMLSNILFPMLASSSGTAHTASGFTGSLTNGYARKVCVEANPPADTGSWLTPYTFCARHPTFSDRIGDDDYIQPDDVGFTPGCFVQASTQSGYNTALDLATRGYRVWVKWTAMRAVVGEAAMLALLEAGEDPDVDDPGSSASSGSDRWRKASNSRGWAMRSCGWTRRPW